MVFYSTNDTIERWVHVGNLRLFLYLIIHNSPEVRVFSAWLPLMGGNSRTVGTKLNQFNLKQVQKTVLFGLKPNLFKVISINMNWLMLNLIKPVLKKKNKLKVPWWEVVQNLLKLGLKITYGKLWNHLS